MSHLRKINGCVVWIVRGVLLLVFFSNVESSGWGWPSYNPVKQLVGSKTYNHHTNQAKNAVKHSTGQIKKGITHSAGQVKNQVGKGVSTIHSSAGKIYSIGKRQLGTPQEQIDRVLKKVPAPQKMPSFSPMQTPNWLPKTPSFGNVSGIGQAFNNLGKWGQDRIDSGRQWGQDRIDSGHQWGQDRIDSGRQWGQDRIDRGRDWGQRQIEKAAIPTSKDDILNRLPQPVRDLPRSVKLPASVSDTREDIVGRLPKEVRDLPKSAKVPESLPDARMDLLGRLPKEVRNLPKSPKLPSSVSEAREALLSRLPKEIREAPANISREGKRFAGDISREGKRFAGDISREGKRFIGDVSRESKQLAGDISREGKQVIADTSREAKALEENTRRELANVDKWRVDRMTHHRERRAIIVDREGQRRSQIRAAGYTPEQAEIIYQIMWGDGLNERYAAEIQSSVDGRMKQLVDQWFRTHSADELNDEVIDQLVDQACDEGMDQWLAEHGLDNGGSSTTRELRLALTGSDSDSFRDDNWDRDYEEHKEGDRTVGVDYFEKGPSSDAKGGAMGDMVSDSFISEDEWNDTLEQMNKEQANSGRPEDEANRSPFPDSADESAREGNPTGRSESWQEKVDQTKNEIKRQFSHKFESMKTDFKKEMDEFSQKYKDEIKQFKNSVHEGSEWVLDQVKDKGKDILVDGGKKLLPGFGGVVVAHEFIIDTVESHKKDVLDRVRRNGDPRAVPIEQDYGAPTVDAALRVAENGGVAFKSPEGLWYYVDDGNYTPKSGYVELIRPNRNSPANPKLEHNPKGRPVGENRNQHIAETNAKFVADRAKESLETIFQRN